MMVLCDKAELGRIHDNLVFDTLRDSELAWQMVVATQSIEVDSIKCKPITNADFIRNMSDSELAHFICGLTECGSCGFGKIHGCDLKTWLAQPRKEDGV